MTPLTYADAALLSPLAAPADFAFRPTDTVIVSMTASVRSFEATVEATRGGLVLVRHNVTGSTRWVWAHECAIILVGEAAAVTATA